MTWTALAATVAQAAPPAGGDGDLAKIVVTILGAGGFLSALFAWWKYRKQGDKERDSLIGQATKEAVEAAKGMLEEYRVELDRAKGEIDDLRRRIQRLEDDLRDARADRAKLQQELDAAIKRRAELEARLVELEKIVERRSRRRRSDPEP